MDPRASARAARATGEFEKFLAQPGAMEIDTFLDVILALCMAELGTQVMRVDSNSELAAPDAGAPGGESATAVERAPEPWSAVAATAIS